MHPIVFRRRHLALGLATALSIVGCGGGSEPGPDEPPDDPGAKNCETLAYPPPAQSPYRLPLAEGSSSLLAQESCSPNPANSHHNMFAYDFEMPIGTPFHAMRGGRVVTAIDFWGNDDHDPNHQNQVVILHDDGTLAVYGHLSPNSIVVAVNQVVAAGQLLAASGNNGLSFFPHLHVHVYANGLDLRKTNTVPMSFSNVGGVTKPSGELILGNVYTALPVP